MTGAEIAEAEVVGEELEPIQVASTLWHSDNPATVLQKATETAEALAPVLRDKGMLISVDGKDYVLFEGWLTLGSMLGVTAVGVWTKPVDGGWEAKVNAQTLDGRVIGSAEAMCLRSEKSWKDSDDFAIRSMAQTRAGSKALASVLRFVVTLAGFQGTPGEEAGAIAQGGFASGKQRGYMEGLLKKVDATPETIETVLAFCSATMEGGRGKGISEAIDKLKPGNEAAKKYGKQLAKDAEEWQAKQTDAPADETDLPDPAIGDEEAILP